MYIVHVHVRVKSEFIEEFKIATIENSKQSVKEPGIARFDVIQEIEDATKFILVEAYRTPEDPARHKETPHYAKWRDTVAEMIAEPRYGVKFMNVQPQDNDW